MRHCINSYWRPTVGRSVFKGYLESSDRSMVPEEDGDGGDGAVRRSVCGVGLQVVGGCHHMAGGNWMEAASRVRERLSWRDGGLVWALTLWSSAGSDICGCDVLGLIMRRKRRRLPGLIACVWAVGVFVSAVQTAVWRSSFHPCLSCTQADFDEVAIAEL